MKWLIFRNHNFCFVCPSNVRRISLCQTMRHLSCHIVVVQHLKPTCHVHYRHNRVCYAYSTAVLTCFFMVVYCSIHFFQTNDIKAVHEGCCVNAMERKVDGCKKQTNNQKTPKTINHQGSSAGRSALENVALHHYPVCFLFWIKYLIFSVVFSVSFDQFAILH